MAGRSLFIPAVVSLVEYWILLALWMAFASNPTRHELWVGLAAALIGSVADAVVKAQGLARFRPKARWLPLIFVEPWYVLSGTAAIFKALLRVTFGKKPRARFKTMKFNVGGDDARSSARRTLATLFSTIPPNSIVVGIDRSQKLVLIHEMVPARTSWLAKQLGVQE